MKLTYDELLALAAHRQFTSHAQLRAYLEHDQIECLLCGKNCVNLGAHINRAHGVTAVEYKRAFHMPRKYALIGKACLDHLKELAQNEHQIEECRALGQIYGPSNGGHHGVSAAPYMPVGAHKPKDDTKVKPEFIPQQAASAPSLSPAALSELVTEMTTRLVAPPVSSTTSYDRFSAQSRLARIEGVLEVLLTALKEYFRETT